MREIIFRAEVESTKRQEFVEFLEWDARVAREQEHQSWTLWFDYFEDPKDDTAFFVYEAYRDQAAFEAHQRNEPYQHWESWIKPKVLTKFQPLFEKGQAASSEATLSNDEVKALKTLNEQFAVSEQQRDARAKAWFDNMLSEHLSFRRANGSVVDKQMFVKSLDDPNPFTSRTTDNVCVIGLEDHALVTLIVRTTKLDGTENFYRNIRLFSRHTKGWTLDRWHNYDVTGL